MILYPQFVFCTHIHYLHTHLTIGDTTAALLYGLLANKTLPHTISSGTAIKLSSSSSLPNFGAKLKYHFTVGHSSTQKLFLRGCIRRRIKLELLIKLFHSTSQLKQRRREMLLLLALILGRVLNDVN